MIWLIISGWLICGACGYVIARHGFTADGNTWTCSDRVFALAWSLLGPFFLCLALYAWTLSDACPIDWDKEVKW